MKDYWQNLINPPMMYSKDDKLARANCKWFPSPRWWAKLNFDGASKGSLENASLRCIIHSDNQEWLVKQAKYLGKVTNNATKIEALIEGLHLSFEITIKKLVIEGDSQVILNEIGKKGTPNWQFNSKLEYALELMDKLEAVQILHIYKEGNKRADALENTVADSGNILIKSTDQIE